MSPTPPDAGDAYIPSLHENRQNTDNSKRAGIFIQSFIKAKKDLLLYPAANPVVNESVQKLLHLLKEAFRTEKKIRLRIQKDGLSVNNEGKILNQDVIRKFSLQLYRRGIREIIMDPKIQFDEVIVLLEILNMKVEEIVQAGGVENLIVRKSIKHASVKGKGELSIVDETDMMFSENALPELEEFEDIEADIENISSPEGFTDTFVRVQEGDISQLDRLRTLLAKPDLFSRLLEKFSLKLEIMEDDLDADTRVKRMLEALQSVGAAIASLPSEQERTELMGNLSVSVLGLSVDLRDNLINRGLVPNLKLRAIEAAILSRFPASRLADALARNFKMSGASASVMRSYFNNLDFTQIDNAELSEILLFRLKEQDLLSPEIESILIEEGSKTDIARPVPVPEESKTDATGPTYTNRVGSSRIIPHIEGYPPEKVLFCEGEQMSLSRQVTEELEASGAEVMGIAVLELLRYEETPEGLATLVDRIRSYIEHFLKNGKYKEATNLIKGLQFEAEQKAKVLSSDQLKPILDAAYEFLAKEKILELIDKFKDIKRVNPDFEEIVTYLNELGPPATRALLHALENESSRHVRLLICHALAGIDIKDIPIVAEMVKHPLWYVARNAVSVLGKIGRPECVPYLEEALEHSEPRVHKEALKGLAGIRTDKAIQLICSCLDKEDADLRKTALGWVSALGAKQALPALERILDTGAVLKQDDDVLRLSIEALENIDGNGSVTLLERLSKTRHLFRWRKAARVRKTAGAALARVSGE